MFKAKTLCWAVLLAFVCIGCSPEKAPTTTEAGVVQSPDEPVNATQISLQELSGTYDRSFVLVENGAEGGRIYRLYVEEEPVGSKVERAYIAYYETEKITADFWNGGSVAVRNAYRNVVSISDCRVFGIRFAEVETKEISAMEQNTGEQLFLLCPEAGRVLNLSDIRCGESASDVEADDMGMLAFMRLLFADRGIGQYGKQHF